MQLSFKDKARFFYEMSQLTRSGIPFQTGLGHLAKGRGRIRAVAEKMLRQAGEGSRASGYFRDFSPLDQALVAAGEENGHLDSIFSQLGEYYSTLEKARREVIMGSLYPLLVLHMGVILLAIPSAVADGGIGKFLQLAGTTLGGFYLLAIILFLAVKFVIGLLKTSVAADRIVRRIPLFGDIWRNALLARFCTVLSLSLRSAGGFFSGITRAADASQSAWLKAVVKESVPEIQAGKSVAEALRTSHVIPEDLDLAIDVAEQSGRMDLEMLRWAEIYRSRLLAGIHALGIWAPRVLYGVVVIFTALRILEVAQGVFSGYQNILNN